MVTAKNLLKLRINLSIVVTDQKTWSFVNNTQYTTPYLILDPVAMLLLCGLYASLTTVHYRLLIATNNKLFLVIFTRELQNLERKIQVTYMTSTGLVEK